MPYGACSKASDPHPQSCSRTSGSVSRTGPQPMRSASAATYVGSRARTRFGPFPFSLLTDCIRSTTNAPHRSGTARGRRRASHRSSRTPTGRSSRAPAGCRRFPRRGRRSGPAPGRRPWSAADSPAGGGRPPRRCARRRRRRRRAARRCPAASRSCPRRRRSSSRPTASPPTAGRPHRTPTHNTPSPPSRSRHRRWPAAPLRNTSSTMIRAPARAIAATPSVHASSSSRNSGPMLTPPSGPNVIPASEAWRAAGIASTIVSVPSASHGSGRTACRHRTIPDLPELEPPLSRITRVFDTLSRVFTRVTVQAPVATANAFQGRPSSISSAITSAR